MIHIQIGKEPLELFAHRTNKTDTPDRAPNYDNFRDMKELRDSLLRDQKYICAYCMRRISEDDMKIEHFRSQSTHPDLDLDYRNMLAVCEGVIGKKLCCDTFRGTQRKKIDGKKVQKDFQFLPNPKELKAHNVQFSYNRSSGTIACCNNADITQEIGGDGAENLLNLNCQGLKEQRIAVWEGIKRKLDKITKTPTLWKKSEAAIREAQKIYDEHKYSDKKTKNLAFCGFVCHLLEREFGDKLKK